MRSKKTPLHLLTIFTLLSSFSAFAQSISGKVSEASSFRKLGYATVNIYRHDSLIANVIADPDGTFKVKLDTGMYKCEVKYAGHAPSVKEIHVIGDESTELNMARTVLTDSTKAIAITADHAEERADLREVVIESHEFAREDIAEDRTIATFDYSSGDAVGTFAVSSGFGSAPGVVDIKDYKSSTGSGIPVFYEWENNGIPDTSTVAGSASKLTATEIDDFSRWKPWTDFSLVHLAAYSQEWDLLPSGRYTVEVTGSDHLPLAGAIVKLMKGNAEIFSAVSDNTGKAELWASMKGDSSGIRNGFSINVTYKGKKKKVDNAVPFDKGINFVVFDADCEQSQNVDIAFVIDATGSMQDEIDYLESDLNDVMYQSKSFSTKLNLRFADVFYRDTMDSYLTHSMDFTDVLSESTEFISSHTADGGGDGPEAVEVALDSAINHLHWRTDTRTKILFLVLDAPPHNTAARRMKMQQLALLAAQKGIRIVPVMGSGSEQDNEYLMRCLALTTNGTNVFLTNNSGIGGSHTAPTTDSYQVEIMNDVLTRIIKSFTYMPDCNQQLADLGVHLPDSLVKTMIIPGDSGAVANNDSIPLQWSFFPNPTHDVVNIVANKSIDQLFITDLSGKVLKVLDSIEPQQTVSVDLSGFPAGIYLVRYPVGQQWVSGKIVYSP